MCNDVYTCCYLPSNDTVANVVLCDLDLSLEVEMPMITTVPLDFDSTYAARDVALLLLFVVTHKSTCT